MLNGVPIGTVCPFAGQIHPITGDGGETSEDTVGESNQKEFQT